MIATYLHDPVVHLSSALGLTLLLGAAALHKLHDRQGFARVLDNYGVALGGMLPHGLRLVLARLLPWLEMIAAVGLVLSFWMPWTALLAGLLLALYALVLVASVARGAVIEDCGCHFGGKPQAPSMALVWRNVLLLLPMVNLMGPMQGRPLVWFDAVTLGFLLCSVAVFYLLANLLISNRISLRAL